MTVLLLSLVSLTFLVGCYFYFSKRQSAIKPVIYSVTICAISVLIWYTTLDQTEQLQAATIKAGEKIAAEPKTVDELIEQIENALREDPNDAELWYELGHGYMADARYEEASVCFSYVLRLEEDSVSSVFAAKATADYYANSQRITTEVQALLDRALAMDEYNYPALMLIGNDHFISFRYKEAISTWQKILDSERQGLDRVTVINSINRAKELQH